MTPHEANHIPHDLHPQMRQPDFFCADTCKLVQSRFRRNQNRRGDAQAKVDVSFENTSQMEHCAHHPTHNRYSRAVANLAKHSAEHDSRDSDQDHNQQAPERYPPMISLHVLVHCVPVTFFFGIHAPLRSGLPASSHYLPGRAIAGCVRNIRTLRSSISSCGDMIDSSSVVVLSGGVPCMGTYGRMNFRGGKQPEHLIGKTNNCSAPVFPMSRERFGRRKQRRTSQPRLAARSARQSFTLLGSANGAVTLSRPLFQKFSSVTRCGMSGS